MPVTLSTPCRLADSSVQRSADWLHPRNNVARQRFTLAELVVTVGVLVLLVLLAHAAFQKRSNRHHSRPQTNGRRLTSATTA